MCGNFHIPLLYHVLSQWNMGKTLYRFPSQSHGGFPIGNTKKCPLDELCNILVN